MTVTTMSEHNFKPLQRLLGRCVCSGENEEPECPIADWMFMGEREGLWTYKRYCDHDEHGGKEYLSLTRAGNPA